MTNCPCGSNLSFAECCEPVITGKRAASTPEELMRSRYSAYVTVATDYLYNTTHPQHRKGYDHDGTREWAERADWEGLEIVGDPRGTAEDAEGEVEFIARWSEKGVRKEHHELAQFIKDDGKWYFTDGKMVSNRPIVRNGPKTGRNDPCPCGSGAKYKKCCGK